MQAFVKSAGYASTASAAATAAAAASDLSKTEILGRRVPGSAAHVAAVVGSDSVVGGGAKDVGKQPLTSLEAVAGVTDSSGRSDTFKGRSEHVSGGCRGAAPNPVPGTGRRRRRTAAASFCGPVFYRALWRRTGKKLCVWKVTSRYESQRGSSLFLDPIVDGALSPHHTSRNLLSTLNRRVSPIPHRKSPGGDATACICGKLLCTPRLPEYRRVPYVVILTNELMLCATRVVGCSLNPIYGVGRAPLATDRHVQGWGGGMARGWGGGVRVDAQVELSAANNLSVVSPRKQTETDVRKVRKQNESQASTPLVILWHPSLSVFT